MLFLVLAWRYGFFSACPRSFPLSLPRVLAWDSHPLTTTSSSKLIVFYPISADGRSFHFHLRVLAKHLGSIFFLPLSGDSLGLLYVPVPHSLPIRSQSTNICWFAFWPGFVTWRIDLYYYSVLTVILWRLANSNTRDSRNSLFLFSQWETTWHKHCMHHLVDWWNEFL